MWLYRLPATRTAPSAIVQLTSKRVEKRVAGWIGQYGRDEYEAINLGSPTTLSSSTSDTWRAAVVLCDTVHLR